MTDLQHHAALHEKAVQKIARQGRIELPPRRRGPRRTRVAVSYDMKVHDLVMAAARANLRPGQRIELVSETEVRIVNR